MPFGLKNSNRTFQRLINKVFSKQIRRNIEAYIDDIVMKSKRLDQYIEDLNEVFGLLRKPDIKLNPKKYVFRVSTEMFFGFIVSQR